MQLVENVRCVSWKTRSGLEEKKSDSCIYQQRDTRFLAFEAVRINGIRVFGFELLFAFPALGTSDFSLPGTTLGVQTCAGRVQRV